MFPAKGYARNPLLNLPRNEPCPCRSGKKYKVCCLLTQPAYVPEHMAKSYAEAMKRPDLVFVTEANQQAMQAELAERRAKCEHKWEKVVSPAAGEAPETTHTICEVCLIDKALWDHALKEVGMDEAPRT